MTRTPDYPEVEHSSFEVAPVPPFRLDLTVWALRRRPDNGIDRWDGRTYRRVLVLANGPAEIAVAQNGSPEAPRLSVELTGSPVGPTSEPQTRAVLTRLLGLERDLSGFYRLAADDPFLAPMAERFRGLKPPRLPTLFECLVNAIACQQLTLTVGIRLLNRLAEAHGSSMNGARAFPLPTALATVAPETLGQLGFSRAKARSIIALAEASARGDFDEASIERLDDVRALEALDKLRGIGRWSAEYALLRGLGRLHVFPADDVGARNNLARRLDIAGPLDYAGVRAAVAPWQPYAGLVYFHLLLSNLAEKSLIEERGS